MSFTKYTSFFLTIYSLLLLPNNQKIILLSAHFHSFNILSSYFLSTFFSRTPLVYHWGGNATWHWPIQLWHISQFVYSLSLSHIFMFKIFVLPRVTLQLANARDIMSHKCNPLFSSNQSIQVQFIAAYHHFHIRVSNKQQPFHFSPLFPSTVKYQPKSNQCCFVAVWFYSLVMISISC